MSSALDPAAPQRWVVDRHNEGGPDLFPRCAVTLSDGTRYLLHIDHPAMRYLRLGAAVPPGTVWARPWSPGAVMPRHTTETEPTAEEWDRDCRACSSDDAGV